MVIVSYISDSMKAAAQEKKFAAFFCMFSAASRMLYVYLISVHGLTVIFFLFVYASIRCVCCLLSLKRKNARNMSTLRVGGCTAFISTNNRWKLRCRQSHSPVPFTCKRRLICLSLVPEMKRLTQHWQRRNDKRLIQGQQNNRHHIIHIDIRYMMWF